MLAEGSERPDLPARVQLDAGARRRHRHRATRVPAPRRACRPTTRRPARSRDYALADRAPRYEVVDTDYGVMYGAYRPAEADSDYWRIAHFLFPFYAMIPTGVLGLRGARARLGADGRRAHAGAHDQPRRRSRSRAPPAVRSLSPPETLPNTTDWYGRFRCVANADNDYLIDRQGQQKNDSYTGIDAHLPAGPGRHREHGRRSTTARRSTWAPATRWSSARAGG